MQAVKILDTNNHTYYCGYITKYEKTEAEKEEQRYMIIQKSVGIATLIIAALSLMIVKVIPEFGIVTIIMALIGVVLILSKYHAFS